MNSIKKNKTSNYVDPDIISNLPDFIVGHILSFLPTKYAVRTSVLSTKWKYMWKFITMLDFDDIDHQYRNKIRKTYFLNFVYRVLLHLNTSSIQSFSISVSENYDSHHVNQWISAVLNRSVKEIFINSKKKCDISLHSLWKSRFLEKLVLKNMDGFASRQKGCVVRVDLPTLVCLSSLTVLKLSGITFTCDSSNDSEKLNLNFPLLRKYETKNCTWLYIKCVTLEVPLLEILYIKNRIESMSDESRTVIKFCAPCLKKFSFSGYMLPDTILLELDLSTACIAYANIHTFHLLKTNEEKTACELLKQFNNNVKYLTFERSEIEYGHWLPYRHFPIHDLALTDLPEFGMLRRLDLGKITGEILFDFLLKTPLLRTLTLKGLLKFDEELLNPENVPSCFTYNLQVINFGDFCGDEHELGFAKFVMENAKVLKRARFTAELNLHGSKFEKVKEQISSFKRNVNFAFVEFSSS